MEQFTIEKLRDITSDFRALFRAYFAEPAVFQTGLRLDDGQLGEVFADIGKLLLWENYWLVLLRDGEQAVGFAVFQIDSPEKDWCDREGWGFLREWYVAPSYIPEAGGRAAASPRRRGYPAGRRGEVGISDRRPPHGRALLGGGRLLHEG